MQRKNVKTHFETNADGIYQFFGFRAVCHKVDKDNPLSISEKGHLHILERTLDMEFDQF